MNSGGSARAARAALFALVCVTTGTGLHRLADGCDPGLFGPALALPLVWLGAYGLARRERPVTVVVLALGLAQLALHFELGVFCPPSTPALVETPAVAGVRILEVPGTAGMPAMPGMSGPGTAHSVAAMVFAHALAVLICGWWLGRGERAFFELCRAVNRGAARAAARTALVLKISAAGCLSSVAVILAAATPVPRRRVLRVFRRLAPRPRRAPATGPRVLRGPPLSPLLG